MGLWPAWGKGEWLRVVRLALLFGAATSPVWPSPLLLSTAPGRLTAVVLLLLFLGSLRCQMAVKKDANQLIDDLLAGQFATLSSVSGGGQIEESLQAILSQDYDFSEEQFRQALLGKRDQIEDFIGVPLTEEQLQAIDGGKGLSTDAKYGIGFGGAVGGIAGGFFAALVIGELVVLK